MKAEKQTAFKLYLAMASRDAISSVRKRAVVQLGRTLEWGSRGRGFKSRQPDHERMKVE